MDHGEVFLWSVLMATVCALCCVGAHECGVYNTRLLQTKEICLKSGNVPAACEALR